MAFENYPKSDSTYEVTSGNTNPRPNYIPLIIGLLATALLATWGYIIYDKNKTSQELTNKDNLIATSTTQKEELQRELEDAAMRYDLLKSSSAKKDSTITAKDAQIVATQNRIKELLGKVNASQNDLAEAKKLIASLNNDLETYRQQIEVLQGEKIALSNERDRITEDRNRIQRNFDSSVSVIRTRDSTLDVGSTLFASNFKITPINDKSGGKEKETTTAKRVDRLNVSFDINQNMITNSGTKDLYVIIYGPDGKAIVNDANASASFTTREGERKTYTKKLPLQYEKSKRQNVKFDWKNDNGFATGDYKIEVFNNGFKIGEGNTTLKKGGLFG